MTIAWSALEPESECRLAVYDARGRMVKDFGRLASGSTHKQYWFLRDDQGRAIPDGVYLVRLSSGARSVTRKAVVVRD
jgi:hypothetical protein